jgi:hypothetical protein
MHIKCSSNNGCFVLQITKRYRTKSIEAEITRTYEEFGDLIGEGTKYILFSEKHITFQLVLQPGANP